MSPGNELCCICEESSPKYKCPVCRASYCSVKCCQAHKAQECTKPTQTEALEEPYQNNTILYQTRDTVPSEKLQQLRESPGIKECLKNPHVRQIMSVIDKSPKPTDLIAQAMLEPIFMEFATECLKVVQPKDYDNLSDEN